MGRTLKSLESCPQLLLMEKLTLVLVLIVLMVIVDSVSVSSVELTWVLFTSHVTLEGLPVYWTVRVNGVPTLVL